MSLIAQPPLPAPPVQTPPSGWLGFLGIKSGGRQPGEVHPTLLPTFDMFKFYQAGARIRLSSGPVAATQNLYTLLTTVPAGRVWIVEMLTATAVIPAGGNVGGFVECQDPAGVPVYMGPLSRECIPASLCQCKSDETIVLSPGTTIGVHTSAAVGVVMNWFVAAYGADQLA